MNTQTCRLCGGDVGDQDPRGGVECSQCGSLVVSEVPTLETLSRFYENFNATYTGGGSSAGRNQIRYAKTYLRLVRKHTRSGTILDIGCANNPFPNIAAQAGFQATAMDYSRPDLLDTNVAFQHGHLNSHELLELTCKFDVITSWAVIEHVADPDLAFAIFAKLLDKDGNLHLTTPEYGTFLTRSSAGKTRWFYPPEHLHLISPIAMQHLAARHSLKLVEWKHFEIGWMRWIVRYGIGLAETLAGIVIRLVNPKGWARWRLTKTTRFIGISYFRFTH